MESYVLEAPGYVVGREREIEIAQQRWLKNAKQPLLVLGQHGIGKSKLALALLHHPAIALGSASGVFEWSVTNSRA
jgi:hypothetical protein